VNAPIGVPVMCTLLFEVGIGYNC